MNHMLRPALRPLVSIVILALCAPALAADEAPADPAQLDRVIVKGSRYLPAYQTRDTRSATKTDTPLVDVPQGATIVVSHCKSSRQECFVRSSQT